MTLRPHNSHPTVGATALEVGRAAYGLAGLLAPVRLAAMELGRPPGADATRVARLLGARHLVQAVVLLTTGGVTAHRVGAIIDGLHAASMLPLAALGSSHRRYYLTSGVVASTLAMLERQASRQPT